jgi:hypothetical protein
MEEANAALWYGTFSDNEEELWKTMQRILLLHTFSEVTQHINPMGVSLTEALDVRNIERGSISFLGREFSISSFSSLFHNGYLDQRVADENRRVTTVESNADWAGHLLFLLGTAATALKAKPIAGAVGVASTIKSATSLLADLLALIRRDETLSAAQREYFYRSLARATANFGGGVLFITTPSGYNLVGTTFNMTQAMVNIAGLESLPRPDGGVGVDADEAIAAWLSSEHPLHEAVYNFIRTNGNCEHRRDFTNALADSTTGDFNNLSPSEIQELLDRLQAQGW